MAGHDSAHYLKLLEDFGAAWNAHDLEALMACVTDDCAFHAVAGPDLLGRSFVGSAALREGFPAAWQTFPDAAWLDAEHFVQGDRGVSEMHLQRHQGRRHAHRGPHGRHLHLPRRQDRGEERLPQGPTAGQARLNPRFQPWRPTSRRFPRRQR